MSNMAVGNKWVALPTSCIYMNTAQLTTAKLLSVTDEQTGGEIWFRPPDGKAEYFGLVDSITLLEVLPDGRAFILWRSAFFYENDHGTHTMLVRDVHSEGGNIVFTDSEDRTFLIAEVFTEQDRFAAWQREKTNNRRKYTTRISNQLPSAWVIAGQLKRQYGIK